MGSGGRNVCILIWSHWTIGRYQLTFFKNGNLPEVCCLSELRAYLHMQKTNWSTVFFGGGGTRLPSHEYRYYLSQRLTGLKIVLWSLRSVSPRLPLRDQRDYYWIDFFKKQMRCLAYVLFEDVELKWATHKNERSISLLHREGIANFWPANQI